MRRLSLPRHLEKMWVAYLVLVLSLIPTAVVYYAVKSSVETRDHTRFERLVRDDVAAIGEGLPRFVEEMRGIRGLFAVNSNVNFPQWQKYVADLAAGNPQGLRTIGYLERVEGGQKKDFLARSAGDSNSPAQILPEGERPAYFPSVYLHSFLPGLTNQTGQDHFAEARRKAAMESARDSDDVRITGKIVFDAPISQSGFAIYLPVFGDGTSPVTPVERQVQLRGYIFADFNSEKLFKGILGQGPNPLLGCAIYDGPEMTSSNLLYGDAKVLDQAMAQGKKESQSVTVRMLNRTWTVYFVSLPAFELESNHNLPHIALICWITLSFLMFAITFGEIEALARAEDIANELRKSEIALADEKELLAVTLYSIADGVITINTFGIILSLNQAAEDLTGWPQNEASGLSLATVYKLETQPEADSWQNSLQNTLTSGTICNPEHPATILTRDGLRKIISRSAAPIHNRDGVIIGAVLVFRDITQRQKSEAELLKENKLESVGLLAGGIAHDFNNILQGIIGNLSLARMHAHSPDKMLERLNAVEKSALRAKELTQQLVMFARGGAPIRRRLQITGVIKDAALQATAGSNALAEFGLSTEMWPVEVDEGQFRQVISNLVLNAIQAMPNGGKIEIKAENLELAEGFLRPLKSGRYVKISIHDQGVGIAPEHLPRIFDPYFTTRQHARGLGLASVYSVVRKHDGQITVDSRLGQGATFYIYLPAAAPAVAEPTPESQQQQRLFTEGRILVMDDEEMILDLATAMLEMMGFEVQVAKDGGKALTLYSEAKKSGKPFTAVITDLTVPEGMGGREFIGHLRQFDPTVKAIVCSGYSLDPVMANYREFGFSGVMPKPYMIEDLKRVLSEVLQTPLK